MQKLCGSTALTFFISLILSVFSTTSFCQQKYTYKNKALTLTYIIQQQLIWIQTEQFGSDKLVQTHFIGEKIAELDALDGKVDDGWVLLHKEGVLRESFDVQDDEPGNEYQK